MVDSEDLPLNISREMLQNNPQVAQMRKALTGRVISELESLAEKDAEAFGKIWDAFGAVLKEGIYEDHERRDALLKLARFDTTAGKARSLKQYVADFKPNQTEIYYLVGESADRLKSNPKLEAARARGIEVLLLERSGRCVLDHDAERFRGQAAQVAEQGRGRFRAHSAARRQERRGEARGDERDRRSDGHRRGEACAGRARRRREGLLAPCRQPGLPGRGRTRARISRSSGCLSRQNRGIGTKPVLELNMKHALVKAVGHAQKASNEGDVNDLSALLFEQAQILDGEVPDDPAAFAARINRLVARGLGASG